MGLSHATISPFCGEAPVTMAVALAVFLVDDTRRVENATLAIKVNLT